MSHGREKSAVGHFLLCCKMLVGTKNEAASFYTVGKNTGVCYTYPEGVSLAYVGYITKGREKIVNRIFVKMMDEFGYDVELTYREKEAD